MCAACGVRRHGPRAAGAPPTAATHATERAPPRLRASPRQRACAAHAAAAAWRMWHREQPADIRRYPLRLRFIFRRTTATPLARRRPLRRVSDWFLSARAARLRTVRAAAVNKNDVSG
jgi:hypothetical protein